MYIHLKLNVSWHCWGIWQTRFLRFLMGMIALKWLWDLTLTASGSYTQHTFVTGLRTGQVLVGILIRTPEKPGQFGAVTWNGVRVAQDYWSKHSPRMNPNPQALNDLEGSSGFQDHKGPLQARADSRRSLKQNVFLWNPCSMEIAFPWLAACVWYPVAQHSTFSLMYNSVGR